MRKLVTTTIIALLAAVNFALPSKVNAAELEVGANTKIEKTEDGRTIYRVGGAGHYDEVEEDYIVVDGAKYSVDGKKLLAIPVGATSFTVKEGTEVVNISAIIKHGHHVHKDDGFCCEIKWVVPLKTLVLPKSLKSIDFDTDNEYGLDSYYGWMNYVDVESVTIQNDKLSAEELSNLFAYFYKLKPKSLKAPNGVVTYKNKMLIYKKSVIKYYGKSENVTVPNGIKSIQKYAFTTPKIVESDWKPFKFEGAKIKKITLPKTLKKINDGAFRGCKKLKTVNFKKASKMRYIGDYAFKATKISKLPYMKNLEHIGKSAFVDTKIKNITLSYSTWFDRKAFGNSDLTIKIKGLK